MDINKLRTLVFEKTGIKIDTNDPIFALVALNEAVLSECVEPHVAALHQAAETLSAQTSELIQAGERYGKLLQQMAASGEIGQPAQIASAPAPQSGSTRSEVWRNLTLMQLLLGAGGIACLGVVLTLGAQWALRSDRPAAATTKKIVAPASQALTPDQILKIENGEKYAKMWPKLDPTTQAKIINLIQQP